MVSELNKPEFDSGSMTGRRWLKKDSPQYFYILSAQKIFNLINTISELNTLYLGGNSEVTNMFQQMKGEELGSLRII